MFQKSKSQAFYEAMFSDARIIGRELDLVVVSRDLGGAAKQAPLLLIPAKETVMRRFTGYLQDQGFRVIVDEGQALTPSLQPLAEQLGKVDMEIVAEQLGLVRDRFDQHKWRSDAHIISINDGKFQDWATNTEGEGAIELVMYVQTIDFKAALAWLSRHSSQEKQLPQAVEGHWAEVRGYLTEVRGLPEDWIDRLHLRGLLYANDQKNAVFLRYSDQHNGVVWARGHPTGASVCGTSEQISGELVTETLLEQGWFWLRQGQGEVQRIVLVQSAIDVLSLAALEREKGQNSGATVYLALDGTEMMPMQVLRSHVEQGGQVVVAFAADKVGERFAWQVAREFLGVRRMSPAVGRDWNDRWLAERQPGRLQAVTECGEQETLKRIWRWFRVSGELGRSEAYRRRIAEVAQDVVDGKSLSERAIVAMEQDFQSFYERSDSQAQSRAEKQKWTSVDVGGSAGLED